MRKDSLAILACGLGGSRQYAQWSHARTRGSSAHLMQKQGLGGTNTIYFPPSRVSVSSKWVLVLQYATIPFGFHVLGRLPLSCTFYGGVHIVFSPSACLRRRHSSRHQTEARTGGGGRLPAVLASPSRVSDVGALSLCFPHHHFFYFFPPGDVNAVLLIFFGSTAASVVRFLTKWPAPFFRLCYFREFFHMER